MGGKEGRAMRLKWGEAIDKEKFNYRQGEAMMEWIVGYSKQND